MTTDELTKYYVDLLILQYANKANARATVDAVVRSLIGDQIIQQVEDAFDLANAVGVQLDAIGTYRGASRIIVGISLDKTFFTMPDYGDGDASSVPGFAVYADGENVPQYWAVYADSQNPVYVLTDTDFRIFIQYLADLHSLDLGLGPIDVFLFKYFGNYVTLDDNGDMTITYTDDPTDPSVLFKVASFTNNLPHPAGVEIIVA